MIVNAHAHVGDSRVFDVVSDKNELIAAMDANGVGLSLAMPSAGCRDAAAHICHGGLICHDDRILSSRPHLQS